MITALVILIPLCVVTAIVEWAMTLPEKMEDRRYCKALRQRTRQREGW